jgi:hypothetical protein
MCLPFAVTTCYILVQCAVVRKLLFFISSMLLLLDRSSLSLSLSITLYISLSVQLTLPFTLYASLWSGYTLLLLASVWMREQSEYIAELLLRTLMGAQDAPIIDQFWPALVVMLKQTSGESFWQSKLPRRQQAKFISLLGEHLQTAPGTLHLCLLPLFAQFPSSMLREDVILPLLYALWPMPEYLTAQTAASLGSTHRECTHYLLRRNDV